jgi:hypothetical protein
VPSLQDLANNLENHRYYSGYGTFTANNLPYGKDRPGGGSSNQPFVVRGVDTRWSPSNFDDGLTQFGVVTLASRTASDLSRVTQFLYTTTKGPLFLLKQTGLQRSNPNIKQIDVNTFDKTIIPTQLYNPLGLNTLAQVALGALGARFTKHGLIPQNESQRNYENYILTEDKDGNNRLQNLVAKLGNENENVLMKYGGGAGSFLGIGSTTIRRFYYSINNPVVDSKSGFISVPVKTLQRFGELADSFRTAYIDVNKNEKDDQTIFNAFVLGETDPRDLPTSVFQGNEFEGNRKNLGSNFDFRDYKNAINFNLGGNAGNVLPIANYQQYNIETRIGVAKPRRAVDRVTYTATGSVENSDRINLIGLYYSKSPIDSDGGDLLDVNDRIVNGKTIRDIVKFRIKVLDNDRPSDPTGKANYGVYIVFRAYISNIRRNVVSKWDAYKYVGRGESFYAYDGFTETVTLSFIVAASSRAEMKPLYQKLNYLVSSMAADYSSAGLMRGNIAELTIGDFFLYQPGIITSFDMIVDEDSNWEIALSEPENTSGGDADMHELPQLIKCTMTFIPIYNFLPRKSASAPFFGINGFDKSKEGLKWLNGISEKLSDTRLAPKETN